MDSSLAAVTAAEATLQSIPIDAPGRAWALYELAKAHQACFSAHRANENLEAARELYSEAIGCESDPVKKARYLNNLGIVHQLRYDQTGNEADLDFFVEYTSQATTHVASDIRPAVLKNHAMALQARYNHRGDPSDLDSCIKIYHDALSLPSASTAAICCNLCGALTTRYEVGHDQSDLNEALEVGYEAVLSTDDQHPLRALILDNYASVLYANYANTNSVLDLESSIGYGWEAVGLAQEQRLPGLSAMSANLGGSLASRFKIDRKKSDLDNAIELLNLAADMTDPQHPSFEKMLVNQGNVLRMRFEETGSEPDLELAVVVCTRAVNLRLSEAHLRAQSKDALGNVLLRKYELSGSPDTLDEAVGMYKQALQHTTSAGFTAEIWHNLGTALQARFELRGALEELDDAEVAINNALEFSLEERPGYASSLAALGNVLVRKFERLDLPDALDRAISAYEEALGQTPETDRTRAGRLTCLGHALQIRYELAGSNTDFTNAVGYCQTSVDISSSEPNHYLCLVNLGNCFLRHVVRETSIEDLKYLDQSITHLELAADKMPTNFAIRGMCLNNLGKAYELRHEKKEDYYDFNKARKYYETALKLESAPPMLRVMAGYRGMLLTWSENPSLGIMFLREATKLLPLISPRLLSRLDQQDNIATFSGLGSIGASILLKSGGECHEAVQTLEMSRGVMNSLLLETRLDTTNLEKYDSKLAKEFIALRDQLDGSSNTFTTASNLPIGPMLDMESRIKATKRINDILKQIHSDDKLRKAFLSPSINDLSLSDNEAIVVINVSSIRSDALIVKRDRMWHLQLKDLHQEDVLQHAREFFETLGNDNPVGRKKTNKSLHNLFKWLWEKIVGPVLLELGIAESTDQWPRIWWIPVGLMSIFPLHAAGDHSGKTNDSALDRVISSYATTIRSLSYSRSLNQRPLTSASTNAVFVAMTLTPNQKDLQFANIEVSQLVDKIPQSAVARVVLQNPTFKQDVLSALKICNVAHFSCHGIADPLNPSNSSLLLSDWETNPLTVADVTALKVTNARLAYLSACHAASNRELDLLDEGIHLTGAFQMAGFPQTIGTLWQVDDERSGIVSQLVWDKMLNPDGTIDFDKAVEGLHHAVRALREQTRRIEGMEKRFPDQPMVWAPFIHMGV
ncbi:CHAT domain-containing protein [Rhexocercosporidium sp. MPI-PUGE-AT-0058]|nr:CHAT domain-containing protein [Rhexocercosporidium sp. MPI-PUGE-AT-0058]